MAKFQQMKDETLQLLSKSKPTDKVKKFWVRASVLVGVTTREWTAPSIPDCRHAVLQIKDASTTGQPGYVVYDRLLCRIVNGVFSDLDAAKGVAQLYNEDPDSRQDMSPNGDALGLIYPKPGDRF